MASDAALSSPPAVRVGLGSYYGGRPPGVDAPKASPVRHPALKGPVPTNRFWSAAVWGGAFTTPIYAHPLVVKAGRSGLGISYPEMRVTAGDGRNLQSSFHARYAEELVLGIDGRRFDRAQVSGYTDWTVDMAFFSDGESPEEPALTVRFGHGFPYVYAFCDGGDALCWFAEPPEVWRAEAPHRVGVEVRGRYYGLFAPPGAVWELDGTFGMVCRFQGAPGRVSIALLPEASGEAFGLLARHAFAVPEEAVAAFRYEEETGLVETVFSVRTSSESSGEEPLLALYPHQWAALDQSAGRIADTGYSYRSPRGPMRLVAGRRIATRHRYSGILPYLPLGDAVDRAELRRLTLDALRAPVWPFGMGSTRYDTYLVGKSLNRIAQLIPIAAQLGEESAREAWLGALKGRLERWLAVPGQRSDGVRDEFFWYDRDWGALLGHPTSHGAASDMNDHHFHYGYYVHAAAMVALYDPGWAAEEAWGGMVKLLARDYASADPGNGLFPRLRCFDPYAGHSWASGTALFPEGNNQESSSESMHAWAGLILFGEATGDKELRDLGIWGYTVESHAVWHYWFDVTGALYPQEYPHTLIARLFGSGGDHDTWWTRHPIEVHGINVLPLTGASLYLGRHPERGARTLEELRREAGAITHWADIICGFEALVDPDRAFAAWPLQPSAEFGETRAHTYHWLSALKSLGVVDQEVAADAPLAAVFNNGERKAYVAYNAGRSPRTVRFSDGFSLEAEPGTLTVRRQ